GADAPSGGLVLRLSPQVDKPEVGQPLVDDEVVEEEPPVVEPPIEPTDPEVEEEDPPTFFGEPLSGNFLWVLDTSGSMELVCDASVEDYDGNVVVAPSRLEIVQFECIKALED